MFPCVPSDVAWDQPIKPHVITEGRKCRDKGTAVVFGVMLLAQLALAAALIASADSTICGLIDEDSMAEVSAAAIDTGFGPMMDMYVGHFVGMMCLVLFCASVWLLSIQKFAKAVTWGTLYLDILLMLAIAVYILVIFEDAVPLFIGMLLGTLGFTYYIYKVRNRVNEAAMLMSGASSCLQANPEIFVVICGLQLLLFGYLALVFAGLISSFLVFECQDDQVGPTPRTFMPWASNARTYLILTMSWTFFSMNMLRSYICSGTAALWVWHSEEGMKHKPFKATSWGVTKSFGSVGISGLITTIVDYMTREARRCYVNCLCACNPFWWLFRIALYLAKDYINAMSRFALTFAAITGEDYWSSAQRALNNLKGNFVRLFIVDSMAKLVLYSGAMVFSICLTFITFGIANTISITFEHQLAGSEYNVIRGMFFDPSFKEALGGAYPVVIIFVWAFGIFLTYYPLLSIIFITFLTTFLAPVFGYAYLFALFVGSLSNYLFCYFAGTILDVVGGLFAIGIINARAGEQYSAEAKPGSPHAVLATFQQKLTDNPVASAPNAVVPVPAPAPVAVAVPVGDPQPPAYSNGQAPAPAVNGYMTPATTNGAYTAVPVQKE